MQSAALGVEVLAVAVIVVAIVYGTVRFLAQAKSRADAFQFYKARLGRSLLLGLELLVAADIVRTVSVTTTMASVTILGMLVLIRTFLSWALVVEMEGRWPWQGSAPARKPAVTAVREAA
jgi:uncharacterized membrane protein